MMKFTEFVKRRRNKAGKSNGAEQSVDQGVSSDSQLRPTHHSVPIGTDQSSLPPAVIPPKIGEAA